MDANTLLQYTQLLFAISGVVSCVIWYKIERHRVRYAPALLGVWCFLLVIFRISRFMFPVPLSVIEVLTFNSLSNLLYLLGAASVTFISISSCKGIRKHGNNR